MACQTINQHCVILHYVLQAGTWFNTEGEQRLMDSYAIDNTLVCTEKALQHFQQFLTQSKVFFQYLKGFKNKQSYPYLDLCFSANIPTFFSYSPKAEIFK